MAGSYTRSTIGSIVVSSWFCGRPEFWRGAPADFVGCRLSGDLHSRSSCDYGGSNHCLTWKL